MSGELADGTIARVEQDGRVLSGGTDAGRLTETMERHASEPAEPAGTGTKAVPAAAVTEGGSAAPAPDAKPQTRGQARFSELAKARDTEKARADAAEARAKELEAKISAPPPAPAAEPKPAAAVEPVKPAERFTYPAYQDAVEKDANLSYDQWEVDRLIAFRDWDRAQSGPSIDDRVSQAVAEREAAREAQAIVERTHAKGREAYQDFDAVLKSGPGVGVNMHADKATAQARVAFIFGHPQSEHLQYAILKDGDLAKKLAGMDDIGFGMEIARLATPAAAQPRRASAPPPPAPYTPVNGSTATVTPPSAELAKKGNFDAYRTRRAVERGVKPRY